MFWGSMSSATEENLTYFHQIQTRLFQFKPVQTRLFQFKPVQTSLNQGGPDLINSVREVVEPRTVGQSVVLSRRRDVRGVNRGGY